MVGRGQGGGTTGGWKWQAPAIVQPEMGRVASSEGKGHLKQ